MKKHVVWLPGIDRVDAPQILDWLCQMAFGQDFLDQTSSKENQDLFFVRSVMSNFGMRHVQELDKLLYVIEKNLPRSVRLPGAIQDANWSTFLEHGKKLLRFAASHAAADARDKVARERMRDVVGPEKAAFDFFGEGSSVQHQSDGRFIITPPAPTAAVPDEPIDDEAIAPGLLKLLTDELPRAYAIERNLQIRMVFLDLKKLIGSKGNGNLDAVTSQFLSNLDGALENIKSNLVGAPTRGQYLEDMALLICVLNTAIVLYKMRGPIPSQNNAAKTVVDQIEKFHGLLAKKFHNEIYSRRIALNDGYFSQIEKALDSYLQPYRVDIDKPRELINSPSYLPLCGEVKGFFHHGALSEKTFETALHLRSRMVRVDVSDAPSLKRSCFALASINDEIVSREVVRSDKRKFTSHRVFIPGLLVFLLGLGLSVFPLYVATLAPVGLTLMVIGLGLMTIALPIFLIGGLIELMTRPARGTLLESLSPTLESMQKETMAQINQEYGLSQRFFDKFNPQFLERKNVNEMSINQLVDSSPSYSNVDATDYTTIGLLLLMQ